MSILRAARHLIPCPAPSPPAATSLTVFAFTLVFILIIIYVALHFAVGIWYFIRLYLDRREEELTPEEVAAAMAEMQVPLVLFSAAKTKLAWSGTACSICLMEFAEGDVLRVLPACGHGFHSQCVDRWLASEGSCPNCRRCVCDGVRRRYSPDEALLV